MIQSKPLTRWFKDLKTMKEACLTWRQIRPQLRRINLDEKLRHAYRFGINLNLTPEVINSLTIEVAVAELVYIPALIGF